MADAPYLRESLQLSDELAALAAESEWRRLTRAERRRLERAVDLCQASIREARERWENTTAAATDWPST